MNTRFFRWSLLPCTLAWLASCVMLAGAVRPASANDLLLKLPPLPAGKQVKSAVAVAPAMKLEVEGKVDGQVVTFAKVLPDTAYDLRVTLSDGTVIQGVDLGWYNEKPARKDAGDLDNDDREQIRAIVQDVPGFYNKRDILMLRGDHDRAVALLRLVRDKDFVNDKGGEVIWRIELWYFKNQNGGWEAVQQQNRILRRERFPSPAARKAAEDPIRWTPSLGGIRIGKNEVSRAVTLEKWEEGKDDKLTR
jgi:hypothetical protein